MKSCSRTSIHGRAQSVIRLALGAAMALLLITIGPVGNVAVHASPKAPTDTLDVTILTPRDGLALNAEALEIQALTREHRAGRSDDDIRTGWLRIDLAIDGVTTQTLDPTVCRGELVAGFRVDLTRFAPGPHVATVAAHKKQWRGTTVRGSASLNFIIDPTLPVRETDRIEEAATPKPFACLSTPDFDRDDDDRSDDFDWRYATLRGSFVPNALSTGIDMKRDRVVLTIDGQSVVIEPGAFVCRAHNRCRFTDNSSPLIRSVRLEQKGHGRWTFTIATRHRPWSPHSLFLRIGANWGGLDYVHDQYVAGLALALDAAHAGQATIGADGGTVQTTDAAGVVIRLIVPPGALTRDTLITATPMAGPPLVGQTTDLHFGVEFEPSGLVFAEPARLELDFATATRPLTDHDFIYLVTSPMTRVPLADNGHGVESTILTASLWHFSPLTAAEMAPVFGNLVDWDPRLAATGHLTLTELARLAEALRVQLLMGCTPGPGCAAVDAAYNNILIEVSNSISSLESGCSVDVATPTRAAFDHWKTLIGVAQGLGLNNLQILDCAQRVLNALVDKKGREGLASPTDGAVTSLDDLEREALGLSFSTAASNAHGKKHDVLAALIDQAGATAAGDPSFANLQVMVGLKARAQGFSFADLEKRVLQQSVPAARTAISRLRSACDANPTAPTTDVAKELARTWVRFVNQDPTAAPTLAADLQRVVDGCVGGRITAILLAGSRARASDLDPCNNSGEEDHRACSQTNELATDVAVPYTLSASVGQASISVTVTQLSPTVIAIDATMNVATGTTHDAGAEIAIDITSTRPGTLSTVDNFATWYSSGVCVVGSSSSGVSIENTANMGGGCHGSGRLATITFTPSP